MNNIQLTGDMLNGMMASGTTPEKIKPELEE
jgi:hypothetical protein